MFPWTAAACDGFSSPRTGACRFKAPSSGFFFGNILSNRKSHMQSLFGVNFLAWCGALWLRSSRELLVFFFTGNLIKRCKRPVVLEFLLPKTSTSWVSLIHTFHWKQAWMLSLTFSIKKFLFHTNKMDSGQNEWKIGIKNNSLWNQRPLVGGNKTIWSCSWILQG